MSKREKIEQVYNSVDASHVMPYDTEMLPKRWCGNKNRNLILKKKIATIIGWSPIPFLVLQSSSAPQSSCLSFLSTSVVRNQWVASILTASLESEELCKRRIHPNQVSSSYLHGYPFEPEGPCMSRYGGPCRAGQSGKRSQPRHWLFWMWCLEPNCCPTQSWFLAWGRRSVSRTCPHDALALDCPRSWRAACTGSGVPLGTWTHPSEA